MKLKFSIFSSMFGGDMFRSICRKNGFLATIFLLALITGTMTGCTRTESVPAIPGVELSEQNTGENKSVDIDEDADEEGEDIPSQGAAKTQEEDDTPDAAAVSDESSWYGSYIIKDYVIRGVTAIGNDEAEGLMFALVEYGPDEFNSDGTLLEAPVYQETLRSREEFAAMYSGSGGGCTFETFEIEGDSLLEVTIENSTELGNTFYICDENKILIHYPGGAFLIAERGQRPDIVLTDENKSFLQAMCYYMPPFVGVKERESEDFWRDFIFYSFTSVPVDEDGNYRPIYGEGERVTVYREDLGYEEGEFKISEEYVQEYARLVFGSGMEMPEFKPAFEDMEEGQTALYYQDGYYYIGESDFDETEYRFRDIDVSIERYGTFALAYYDILMFNDNGDREVVGTVEFYLDDADNANGFRIVSKEVEYMQ